MKYFVIISFFIFISKQSAGQTDKAVVIDGDYAYWKGPSSPNIRAFKKADSLLRKDSLQILKIVIGGDYNFDLKYQRFYYSGKEWKYDSNQPNTTYPIKAEEFSNLSFILANQRTDEHETYLKVKDINSTTDKRTFFYFIVYQGKVIKSLTSSIPFADISNHILKDDQIFSIFHESSRSNM